MRETISLNNNWFYKKDFDSHYIEQSDRTDWEEIRLPHSNTLLPYNGFDESEYQFISTYCRDINIDASAAGKTLLLHFEGVMTACTVWVNGKEAGEHKGGYSGFRIDITPYIRTGESNRVTVRVDSTEREDIPPFGKVVDFLTFGGIYREVSLEILNPLSIENIKIETGNELKENKSLTALVFLRNSGNLSGEYTLNLYLSHKDGKEIHTVEKAVTLEGIDASFTLSMDELKGLQCWEPDNPVLYRLEAGMVKGDEELDRTGSFFGFRTARFTPQGFFLNGKLLKIRGLNRHQSFPYVGYAMSWRAQKRDADILKFELGLNMVRTSHYPQSRHFLDRCDEIGLLVFEEIPGWQHIGNAEWQDNACTMVEEMIRTDWNRPSIVIWGVRINESEDNHDFYRRTNKIARDLDGTRQTGGVRYIEKSEFLEDVYTMNDFVHAGGKEVIRPRKKVTGKKNIPYLITEHSGHMFPTKRFDQEERLQEKALRHLRILNAATGDKEVSGAIGWCAFDYNTHREFGSGDRICYHGVSDMFRIPKYSAAVYSSQMSPEEKIVMETASLFSKGERDAARILPIYIYTNCDYVKIIKNGKDIGDYFPAAKEFPHMNHAPVIIRDLVGNQLDDSKYSPKDRKTIRKMMGYVMMYGEEKLKWHHYIVMGWLMKKYRMNYSDLVSLFLRFAAGWGETEDVFEIVGFYKDREVVRKTYGSGRADKLSIKADDRELQSGDWDTTRIEIRLVDQYGNIMPYVNDYIEFEINGPGEIIGPSKTALVGGVISSWIKTTGDAGTIKLKAYCSRFATEEVEIKVL